MNYKNGARKIVAFRYDINSPEDFEHELAFKKNKVNNLGVITQETVAIANYAIKYDRDRYLDKLEKTQGETKEKYEQMAYIFEGLSDFYDALLKGYLLNSDEDELFEFWKKLFALKSINFMANKKRDALNVYGWQIGVIGLMNNILYYDLEVNPLSINQALIKIKKQYDEFEKEKGIDIMREVMNNHSYDDISHITENLGVESKEDTLESNEEIGETIEENIIPNDMSLSNEDTAEITALKRSYRSDAFAAELAGHLVLGAVGQTLARKAIEKRKIAPKKEADLHFNRREIWGCSDRGKAFCALIQEATVYATAIDQVNVYIKNEKGKNVCYSFNQIFGSKEFVAAFNAAKSGNFNPKLYDYRIGQKAQIDNSDRILF